jgi:hypothetical protein
MDNQMVNLLDTTHLTIHTNPTNLGPMYSNQMHLENGNIENNIKSMVESKNGSPIAAVNEPLNIIRH